MCVFKSTALERAILAFGWSGLTDFFFFSALALDRAQGIIQNDLPPSIAEYQLGRYDMI